MDPRMGASMISILLLSLSLSGCVKEKPGCATGGPVCQEAFDCIDDRCIPKKGCSWGNPPCDGSEFCFSNECILRSGCDFSNPACSDNESCLGNMCVQKEGCEYGNPVCPDGHRCEGGACIEELRDPYGRLTSYAISKEGGAEALDLSMLEKLHPERYGTDHEAFGGYPMRLGDGFIQGDLLIKATEFHRQNATSEGYIVFEVFRKEADGEYYHYPTREYKVSRLAPALLQGLVIESPSYSYDINLLENPLVFYPGCDEYNKGCSGAGCRIECESGNGTGRFQAYYPEGYGALSDFAILSLDSAYPKTSAFLGFDPGKDVTIFVHEADRTGPILADDWNIRLDASGSTLDSGLISLEKHQSRLASYGCSPFMRLGHELVHVMTSEMLSDNVLLFEGAAEFAEVHNNCADTIYLCEDEGWRYPHEVQIRAYSDMSAPVGAGILPNHYATGFCFYQDYIDEYGYGSFVSLMRTAWERSRGSDPYYLLDAMEEVNGEPLPQEILERYSLERESTYVDICRGCRDLFQED